VVFRLDRGAVGRLKLDLVMIEESLIYSFMRSELTSLLHRSLVLSIHEPGSEIVC
jgi:hypothetical protein